MAGKNASTGDGIYPSVHLFFIKRAVLRLAIYQLETERFAAVSRALLPDAAWCSSL
jgi:hypothetical protein